MGFGCLWLSRHHCTPELWLAPSGTRPLPKRLLSFLPSVMARGRGQHLCAGTYCPQGGSGLKPTAVSVWGQTVWADSRSSAYVTLADLVHMLDKYSTESHQNCGEEHLNSSWTLFAGFVGVCMHTDVQGAQALFYLRCSICTCTSIILIRTKNRRLSACFCPMISLCTF